MTIQLYNSIINKLLSISTNVQYKLIFNSDAANSKYIELNKIISTLNITSNEFSLRVLAGFFQFSNINNLFTEEEWNILINKVDYTMLTNSSMTTTTNKYNYNTPLYQVGNSLYNNELNNISVFDVKKNFAKLYSMNKNISMNYLVNYIINQL